MKLNNKGFAISSIMYIILIMAVILISVTLAILSSRKLILDKIKKETADNIYGISYNSVINTLKHEAISYASSNNIEQENIKIGDFETSVSQELLEHHELLDKYLTLYKNNYSYDVYLGQTKKVTDISKPISNMLGITDYKIEGNSYQQTYTGKNLFDPTLNFNTYNANGIEVKYLEDEDCFVLNGTSTQSGSHGRRYINLPITKGETFSISVKYISGTVTRPTETTNAVAYFGGGDAVNTSTNWQPVYLQEYDTKTENVTCKYDYITDFWFYTGNGVSFNNYKVKIQLEKGTTATSYEPYVGGVASPNPDYPQEVESVGDKTNNLINADLMAGFTKYDDGTYTLNGASNNKNNSVKVFLKADTIYSEQIKIKTLVGEGSGVSIRLYNEAGTLLVESATRYDTNYVYNFSVSEDGYYYLCNSTQAVSSRNTIVEYIQLLEGEYTDTTIPEYEPYGYRIPVKVSGKNLLQLKATDWNTETYNPGDTVSIDYDKIYYMAGSGYIRNSSIPTLAINNNTLSFTQGVSSWWGVGFPIKVQPNTTYTISGIRNNGDTKFLYALYDNTGKHKKYAQITTNVSVLEISSTITIPSDVTTMFIIISGVNQNDTIQMSNIQVEKGDITTGYEPYVEPVTTNIYLDEPLRKINENIDSLVFENKNVVRNVGKVLLGDFEWKHLSEGYTEQNKHFMSINSLDNYEPSTRYYTDIGIYSNTFIVNTANSTPQGNNYLCTTINASNLRVKADQIGSAAEFKSTFANSEVYYRFATPTEETIELPNIPTIKGTTILSVDTTIQPSNLEFTIIEKIRKL